MPPPNLYARAQHSFATIAHETAGAARTRSSLRPLYFEGEVYGQILGRVARRDDFGCLKFESSARAIPRCRPCERRDPYAAAVDGDEMLAAAAHREITRYGSRLKAGTTEVMTSSSAARSTLLHPPRCRLPRASSESPRPAPGD